MKATDRHKLIDRIKTLEGLTDDERSALLSLLREHKTYGLVWEDKPEDVEDRLRDELPVLVEVKERAILAPPNSLTDNELPNHIIIEGDNLEALATLAYTHAGKIDVIYIDPPYNTGNKDFVYNDSFVDTEDSYRHSKWLSFMSRRLRIAKKLLSDRGVIFISIDDNEQAALKLLCDEIFGQQNFVSNIIWEKADSPRMDAKTVSSKHDFILTFAKDLSTLPIHRLVVSEIPAHYNKTDESGRRYYLKPLRYMGNADSREDRPKMYFPLIAPDGTEVFPIRADGSDGRWRWSKEKYEKEKARIEFVKTKKGWSVYTRLYAENMDATPVESIWYNKDVESNRQAIATIKLIFGSEKTFTNPKPIKLIQRIASIVGGKESYILDFFAGSGTTLHAVMQLNAEDGGHRQCILCTNNENGICENVTYERNKRVIEGYTKPNGEHVEGLHNNNLRYYRTDFVSRSRSTKNMRRLMALATDMLCIKEDLYTEVKTFAGLPTYKNIYRYFERGERKMLIVYDERYVDELVGMIASVDTDTKIKVYVFSPSEDPWEASFEPVADKVELCALPQAIYNTYKRILPKRRPEPLAPAEKSDKSDWSDTSDKSTEPATSSDDEIGGLFTHQVDDE